MFRRFSFTLLLVFAAQTPVFAQDFGNWQAPEMFLLTAGDQDRFRVQLGPLPSGPGTVMECLAIAFYKNEEVVKTYTARDIVRHARDLGAPLTHYGVFGRRHGFRRSEKGRWVFELEDYRGRLLSFDAETGACEGLQAS